MGIALRGKQILFLVLVFLALLVAALVVIHAAMPSLWHSLVSVFSPDVINHYG